MAAFHGRVPGLVHSFLLIAASTAVLALPTANDENGDAVKVGSKANGEKLSVDFRNSKCMPPIATEFLRGSDMCVLTYWAQPAVVMAEYLDCMSSRKKVLRHFSVEQILECALPDWNTSCTKFNAKKVADALDYLVYAGISLNASYSETEDSVNSTNNAIDTCHANKTKVAYMLKKGYQNLKPFDEKNMAQQISKTGPILATLYFDTTTVDIAKNYSAGLLNDSICPKTVEGYSYTASAQTATVGAGFPVMVVGYGTLDGVQIWILRSDWYGASWGMGGYFYIKRGVNACNIGVNPMRVLG